MSLENQFNYYANNNNNSLHPQGVGINNVARNEVLERAYLSKQTAKKDSVTLNNKPRKDGLIARIYNGFRRVMKKDTEKTLIEKATNGEISNEEANNSIKEICNSKRDITNLVAGTGAAAVSGVAYSKLNNIKNLANSLTKGAAKKYAPLVYAIPAAIGFAVHGAIKLIDGITADKQTRKDNKAGAILATSDVASGIMMVASPLLIPVGLAMGIGVRYFSRKNDQNELATTKDFNKSQKNIAIPTIIAGAALTFAAIKGHASLSKVTKAIENTKVNTKNMIEYLPPVGRKSEFQNLANDLGYDLGAIVDATGKINIENIAKIDEEMLYILLEKGKNGDITHKMKRLEEANIFFPKYFQTLVDISDGQQKKLIEGVDGIISSYNARKNETYKSLTSDNYIQGAAIDRAMSELEQKGMDIDGIKDLKSIIQNIKSNCPPSRTVDGAQEMINKLYGNGKYSIIRGGKKDGLLGVGSIAESYLAKDKDGNAVVIKLVKDHFDNSTIIDTQLKSSLKKVDERTGDEFFNLNPKKTIRGEKHKKYVINQLESMYKTWGNELKLANEATNAQDLASQAKRYNVVGVIESKDNSYVMQKANGIQLDSEDIAKQWKDAGLDETDFKNFTENYIRVYSEQLFTIPKKGMEKVVQSDPHGGNLLIDLKKIKELRTSDKANPITIIDYGNVTRTSSNEATEGLFSHLDYIIGNTDGIAKTMLHGADLGDKNVAKAQKELSKMLQQKMFNSSTKINLKNPVEIFNETNAECLEFMQKNNIIPNANHINQMKAESTYILSNLGCLNRIAEGCGYDLAKALDKDLILKQIINEMGASIKQAVKQSPQLTVKELTSRGRYLTNNTETAFTCMHANFGVKVNAS